MSHPSGKDHWMHKYGNGTYALLHQMPWMIPVFAFFTAFLTLLYVEAFHGLKFLLISKQYGDTWILFSTILILAGASIATRGAPCYRIPVMPLLALCAGQSQ